MKRFNHVCSVTLEQEITKYSKEEAEKLRKEMQANAEKKREEDRIMIEKLMKEVEM